MLTNAILYSCEEQYITIEQKYIIIEHTQMECNAIHSLIVLEKPGKPGNTSKSTSFGLKVFLILLFFLPKVCIFVFVS